MAVLESVRRGFHAFRLLAAGLSGVLMVLQPSLAAGAFVPGFESLPVEGQEAVLMFMRIIGNSAVFVGLCHGYAAVSVPAGWTAGILVLDVVLMAGEVAGMWLGGLPVESMAVPGASLAIALGLALASLTSKAKVE